MAITALYKATSLWGTVVSTALYKTTTLMGTVAITALYKATSMVGTVPITALYKTGGGGGGGLNAFYWYQIFALDSAVVEVQEMFSWHGGLLTNAMHHTMMKQ